MYSGNRLGFSVWLQHNYSFPNRLIRAPLAAAAGCCVGAARGSEPRNQASLQIGSTSCLFPCQFNRISCTRRQDFFVYTYIYFLLSYQFGPPLLRPGLASQCPVGPRASPQLLYIDLIVGVNHVMRDGCSVDCFSLCVVIIVYYGFLCFIQKIHKAQVIGMMPLIFLFIIKYYKKL